MVDDTVARMRRVLGIPGGEAREGTPEVVPDRFGPELRVIQGKRGRTHRKTGDVRRMVRRRIATAPGSRTGRIKRA